MILTIAIITSVLGGFGIGFWCGRGQRRALISQVQRNTLRTLGDPKVHALLEQFADELKQRKPTEV